MFTWHDNNNEKFLLLLLCVCVCSCIYVEKFYDVSNENLAHSSAEWAHTAHIHTYSHMCICIYTVECAWNVDANKTSTNKCTCVYICVFIITNTILSIKINSTKGNRADASAFFLHSVNSSDNPGNNVGSTQPTKKQTISVERLTDTHTCVVEVSYKIRRAFTWCIYWYKAYTAHTLVNTTWICESRVCFILVTIDMGVNVQNIFAWPFNYSQAFIVIHCANIRLFCTSIPYNMAA